MPLIMRPSIATSIVAKGSRIFEGLFGQTKNAQSQTVKVSKIEKTAEPSKSILNVLKVRVKDASLIPAAPRYEQPFWLRSLLSRHQGPAAFSSYLRSSLHQSQLQNYARFFNPFRKSKSVIPFYALVGFVSCNAEAFVKTQDELSSKYGDETSKQMKEIVSEKYQKQHQADSSSDDLGETLNDYKLGSYISKGSNAAVYEVEPKFIDDFDVINEDDVVGDEQCDSASVQIVAENMLTNPFVVDNTRVHNNSDGEDDFVVLSEKSTHTEILSIGQLPVTPSPPTSLMQDINTLVLCESPRYAMKVMFNPYSSNEHHIMSLMANELIPADANIKAKPDCKEFICTESRAQLLPRHDNIICIRQYFVDDLASDIDPGGNFSAWLPPRINPQGGFGRNKTLFLVMDRYDTTLCRMYKHHPTLSVRQQTLVWLQLMEAVAHLRLHGVAHRDLKSNNVLLRKTSASEDLHVCICDLGLAYIGKPDDMRMPYNSNSVTKGGNATLQAPEISTTRHPARGKVIDYDNSDVWALGAMAYEIYGAKNPFYRYKHSDAEPLNSASYHEEQLPDLPDRVPYILSALAKACLTRDHRKRPSAARVADCLHLLLWLPEDYLTQFLSKENASPSKTQLMYWLMMTYAQVTLGQLKHRDDVSIQVKRSMLRRLQFDSLLDSLHYLKSLGVN